MKSNETAIGATSPFPKPATKKTRTPKPDAAAYQSFTRGDRAYTVSDSVLSQIKTTYPFLFDFLTINKYDAARELKIFISHILTDPTTNKKTRVNTFISTTGTNKIKTFPKPKQLTFSIADAVKTFPSLKPITALTDPTVYITISAKSDFRFYVSYKN